MSHKKHRSSCCAGQSILSYLFLKILPLF